MFCQFLTGKERKESQEVVATTEPGINEISLTSEKRVVMESIKKLPWEY